MKTDTDRSFWEKQAANYQTAFEKLPELADYTHRAERQHLFKVVKTKPEMNVLDLGCGTGRWSFEFAKRCRRVVAVDFASGMIKRASEEARQHGLGNIEFHLAKVEDFRTSEKFDIIIISGVLVYFEDFKLPSLLENVATMLMPDGLVISRETVAIETRQEIQNEIHAKIKDKYSAIYRLPQEYKMLFASVGLKCVYSKDFVPTNFPMILYRRFVPSKIYHRWLLRKLLQLGLILQSFMNPVLLRYEILYRPIMNRFWKIKSMLFIYRAGENR